MNNLTFDTLVSKIDTAHQSIQSQTIKSISTNLTIRNWIIGCYIVEYEQDGSDRAKYGDRLIEKLSKKLNHIKGISATSLRTFRSFYIVYPQIQQTLSVEFKQLSINQNILTKLEKNQTLSDESFGVPIEHLLKVCSFSHFLELIKLDDKLQRVFYEIETIKGAWSVRELKRQINSQTYQRVGLSSDKKSLINSLKDKTTKPLPKEIIKDPYILEFTGLEQKVKYSENDLEDALLNHLQDFLLELGNGFCFESRQKRISIENEHDRIDLVFYHRILKCHILIDLKIREFSYADVGQMNFYLNYFKNEIMQESDNPPIGLILCANKNHTKVEYATSGLENEMFISKYKINLPSIEELEEFISDELDGLGSVI